MNKSLLLSIAMFFLFFLVTDPQLNDSDDIFHFKLSQDLDNCPVPYEKSECESYPPLSHILSNPFSFNRLAFKTFHLALLMIVIPLMLFYFTKRFSSTILYFGSYYLLVGAINFSLAQTFIVMQFLIFLYIKNKYLRFFLLFLGLITHNSAIFLFALYWFLETFSKEIKGFFLAIPSFPFFNGKINLFSGFVLFKKFFSQLNFLTISEGFSNIIKKQNWAFLILILISVAMAFGSIRHLWVAQLLLVISASHKELKDYEIIYSFYWIGFIFSWLYFPNTLPNWIFLNVVVAATPLMLYFKYWKGGTPSENLN